MKNSQSSRSYSILIILFLLSFPVFSQVTGDTTDFKEYVNMTVEQFKDYTGPKHKLVLVNFKADWCVVCKKEKPVLLQLMKDNPKSLEILVIDMEKNPLIAEYFEVDGLPISLLYKNGAMVWDRMGLLKIEEFNAVLTQYK